MTRIDRYILVLFLRTVLISFFSLSGVFVVFHAFNSMDELSLQAETGGGLLAVLVRWYGPYLLLLFDWTGAIITLMAFLFTAGWLRRTGELTATLSAGVSHGRIFRPMIAAAVAIILVQFVNREWILPRFRDDLTMKARDLNENAEQSIISKYDRANGILIDGRAMVTHRKTLLNPSFLLYGDFETFGDLLAAEEAVWLPAGDDHPEGFLLRGVTRPPRVATLESIHRFQRPILLTARDQPWIKPDECFVATTVQTDMLQTNAAATRQASVMDIIAGVRNPAVHTSDATRVFVHERIVRVPLDIALVLMVLPLVVNRKGKNLFVSIAAAFGIVMLFFAIKTVAGACGGSGYLISPAMAAWIPLLVFGPLAYVRYRGVQVV